MADELPPGVVEAITRTLHAFVRMFRAAGIPRGLMASILLGAAAAEAKLSGCDINDVVAVILEEWKREAPRVGH